MVLKTLKAQAAKAGQNKTIQNKQALLTHLKLDEKDTAGYFAAVAEIMSMPVAIRRDVAALESPIAPPTLLLQHMDKIEGALPLLGTPTGSVKQLWDRLGDDVIVGLEITSHILAQGQPQKVIDQATLGSIRNLATEIIDDLADDDGLPLRFREEIRRHAQCIIDAVNAYKVHGADGLLDEADAMIGVIVRNASAARQASTPAGHSVFRKLGVLANTIVLAVTMYAAPHELAEATNAYGDFLELPSIVQAPAEDIVDAEEIG